jgi:hypothetical protein
MTWFVVLTFAVEEGAGMDDQMVEKMWFLCSNSERNDEKNDGQQSFLVIK